ncbi:MAG: hypothetical protein K2F79_09685 [Muribaculaceae bacterium]|nr:hypothetical protein [Muribaculaceae bacterium]
MPRLIVTLVLALAAVSVFAQSKIDSAVEKMEKSPEVETTYTERRTRSNHKLYRVTKIMKFNNDSFYRMLKNAFESERKNTVSAIKSEDVISYKFHTQKGSSSYSLTTKPPYTFIMQWNDPKISEKDNDACIDDIPGVSAKTNYGINCAKSRSLIRKHEKLKSQHARLNRKMERIKSEMSRINTHSRKNQSRYKKYEKELRRLQSQMNDIAIEQAEIMSELETPGMATTTTITYNY